MTRRYLSIAALVAAGVLAGAAPAQDAPAPIKTKSGEVAAPAAGKGQVVFFRPGSLMGAALGCTVHEGEAQVARLGSGKYYVIAAEPGKHEYSTKGEATDRLNLEVEPGETYFVKCNIGMGVMSGRANLSPSDRDAFAKKAKGMALWKGPSADKATDDKKS